MNAQTQDLEQIAREALGFVSTSGIDRLGEENRKHLQYGLKQGLFKQEAVDAAQKMCLCQLHGFYQAV